MDKNDPEAVGIEISDTLDLHLFQPAELIDLLENYISECNRIGISPLRIIHGKGTGLQRRRVQSFLEKNPHVTTYGDAPPAAGGWGATIAELKCATKKLPRSMTDKGLDKKKQSR